MRLFNNGVVLVPRLIHPEKVKKLLTKYLSPDNEIVIDIFKYLHSGFCCDIPSGKRIFLIQWDTPKDLIGLLLSRIGYSTQVVSLFKKSPSKRRFRQIDLQMSPSMYKWYRRVTEADVPIPVKEMVGNYYFTHSNDAQLMNSLHNPCKYTHRFKHLSEEFEETEQTIVDGIMTSNGEIKMDKITINSLSRFYPKVCFEDFASKIPLVDESPKINYLLNEYVKNPGKWVILTSFDHLYGVKMIQYFFFQIFNGKAITMDSKTIPDEEVDLVSRFDESTYNILISSIVPMTQINGVDRLVVFDAVDFGFVIESMKYINGTDIDIDILSVIGPQREETYSYRESQKSIRKILQYEKVYSAGLEKSDLLHFSEGKMFVE